MTTQRITLKDIERGQIRFPGPSKSVFPQAPGDVEVELNGMPITGRWNPRNGPDRDRSGVLRVGRQILEAHVQPDETLTVTERAGRIILGNGSDRN